MQEHYSHEIDASASLNKQASAWWVLLNYENATAADHRAFRDWVTRSPERVEAFLRTAILARTLESKQLEWPDTPIDALIQEAKGAARAVADHPAARRPAPTETRSPSWRAWIPSLQRAGLVAMLGLVITVAMIWRFSGTEHFQTALGEQRSLVLSDGSVISLNTSSAVEVRMTKHRRTVELLSGEALFEVAHDAARPFDVTVGNTTVRAVGTQFNVDRRLNSTTVTVVEGNVAVFTGTGQHQGDTTKLPLAAGEQLTVTPRTAPHPVPANLTIATAWTQRKLVFEHRPLGEVAEEFNRYNLERIEIDSPELRNEEISGVFEANNPESFMSFLSKVPDVRIERDADGHRLLVTRTSAGTTGP